MNYVIVFISGVLVALVAGGIYLGVFEKIFRNRFK